MYKFTFLLFTLSCVLFNINTGNAQDLAPDQYNELNNQASEYFDKAFSIYTGQAQVRDQKSFEKMISLFNQANAIFQKVNNTAYIITIYQILFDVYQKERSYEMMDQVTLKCLSQAKANLDKDALYFGEALNMRGISTYRNKKDYNNAISFFKQSLKIYKYNKVSLLDISVIDFNLSECFLFIGDYDQAIKYSENALAIQTDSANWNTKIIPKLYDQLGLCYSKKKESALAVNNFKKGIKTIQNIKNSQREIDQILLYLYQNIAAHLLDNNQLNLAHEYIDKAVKFQSNQAFIRDAYTYEILGKIFLKEDELNKALSAFQQSTNLAKLEYKNFDKHPEIGNTYIQTANAWLAKSEIDSALNYFQLAIINHSVEFDINDIIQNPPIERLINPLSAIDILEGKAKAFLKKYQQIGNPKNLEFAFNNYALAIDAISKTRRSFNAEGSKHILAEKVNSIYENAIEISLNLFEISGSQKWLEKGFEFAESNKAAALLEAIQDNEALNTTGIPDSLLQQEYNLKVDIAFYEKLIYEAQQKNTEDATQKVKDLNNRRFELDEAYQLLIDHFEANYPDYFALKFKAQKIKLSTIQSKLKGDALLEFFVGDQNIFAFTITNTHISCEKILKTDHFESDISALRKIISTPPNSKSILNAVTEFSTLSNRLYKNILAPSIQNVPSSTQKLIIIPDDILAYIPFSIFIENVTDKNSSSFKNLDYLFRKFKISYNYSTALWLKFSQQKNKVSEKKFIGFAPEFSAYKEEASLSPLSCNTQEIQGISELLNVQETLLNTEARLKDFKQCTTDFQVIHLATHTSLDNENSAFNKIFFSDQALTQNDLYQLKLNASLVVLSACNTGSGTLKKGEGIMSLSRGFIHAGCPSVLMSLWSVDDCATADIMLNYYKGLGKGKTKESALLFAKEDYLKNTEDILQAHPYYWAAFVQHGSTEALKLSTHNQWMYWIIGFSFLFLLIIFGIKRGTNKKRPL